MQQKDIPPTDWLVENLIPQGVSLLCAPSKTGKSWMMMQLAIAIATGQPFLGFPTKKRKVMYYAFEDDESRLLDRMNKLLNGTPAPENIIFSTDVRTLDNGLINNMTDDVFANPDIDLIIIDTLQKVRGRTLNGETVYAYDYREIGEFKKFYNSLSTSVLLVHHTRKQKDSDSFNQISGTTGLMGAADTTYLLTRNSRTDNRAILSMTGRDIMSNDLILSFDKDTCLWSLEDSVAEADRKNFENAYNISPVVATIRELVAEPPYEWSGTITELLNMATKNALDGEVLTERKVAREIADFGFTLETKDGIHHKFHRRADGRIHTFYREKTESG
jgi:RecA-family ATPase